MARERGTDRNTRRPFIEEPPQRPPTYREHPNNYAIGFVYNNVAEYPQTFRGPAPPQYPPRPAPWPQPQFAVPWTPAPPRPIPSAATPNVGTWPQGNPMTQHHGQQIPAQYPQACPSAQNSTGFPPAGFHHTAYPYRGPSQRGLAAVRPPPVPQPFQQPLRHFLQQRSGATGCHKIRPGEDGFATPPSGYRPGHFDHQAGYAFNRQEMPHYHRGQHCANGPTQYSTDEIASSDDDAGAVTRPLKKRNATPEDAAKYGLPAYYELYNWDPDEQPIVLCGTVYDPDTIGHRIHAWNVAAHGPYAPEAKYSRQLRRSMRDVTRKLRESTTFISQSVGVKSLELVKNKEIVEDFVKSGQHLMERMQKLVQECEKVMFDPNKKNSGELRENHGIAFVHAVFNSETHSEKTAGIMKDMRLWISRWKANCQEVINAGPGTEQPVEDGVDRDQDSHD